MTSGSNDDDAWPVGALGSLTGPNSVARTENVEASASVASVASVEDKNVESISQLLAAGSITATQAQEQLIDSVVREQLGPLANPALEAQIRDEIAALLDGDPTLARLLDPRQ